MLSAGIATAAVGVDCFATTVCALATTHEVSANAIEARYKGKRMINSWAANFPQGLKPQTDFVDFIGTTKVVPFQKRRPFR
jgi:hypothetical protein